MLYKRLFILYNDAMREVKITPPVAILGFGIEGRAALDFLLKRNIKQITVYDEKTSLTDLPEGVEGVFGKGAFDDFGNVTTIIRSPGVYYKLPALIRAHHEGVWVTSLTELTLQAGYGRVTAITGSNGKTTTTGLTEHILKKRYDKHLIVGGNDRQPVLEEALSHPTDPILLEVSSFQFADLPMSPHIAAVLNIKPNHMDWHENMVDYVNAKANLIAHQNEEDWAVLNANDENSAKLGNSVQGNLFWVGKKRGKAWAVWEDGKLIIHFGGHTESIMTAEHLKVKTHPDNILCAVALGFLHGVKTADIIEAVKSFKGMSQRLEFIREVKGVKFYNDSACTTPESAEVAIDAFLEGKLILLLGGSSKDADFRFLGQKIVEKNTRAIVYGAEGSRIRAAIEAENKEVWGPEEKSPVIAEIKEKDFEKVIHTALKLAQKGDHIVLSPACASFDMFKNSKERGEVFEEMVKKL